MVVALVVLGSIFGYRILAAGNKISVTHRSILGQLKDLLLKSGDHLAGEADGRINILLLAVGGEGHSGEELADTIMIASIRPQSKDVALLSIPRDLYVPVPGEKYYSKINAVHAYGEAKRKDQGPELLRQKVAEITGLPIHYYGRVDFQAFKHVVDAVGGVEITIPNTFYDYWHKISFPAGTEKMNGERALAYVRARYVEGPEGGDFRRAARQQQMLLALRDKVFSVQTALDFSALNSILNSLSNDIRTDMQLWEMKRLFELARALDHDKIHTVVPTTGVKGILVGSTEILGGVPAAVLRTRTGDYSELQALAQNIFNQPSPPLASESPSPSPTPAAAKPTVEIRNGTTVTGLAQRIKDRINSPTIEVVKIGNAVARSTQKTTVYALDVTQADAAKDIADTLLARADSGLPDGEAKSSAAILIIVGQDAAKQ